MPERGHNRLSLTLTSELLVALNKFSGKRNQGTLTSALWILTKHLKPELDEINPQAYDKHLKQYSKTVAEQVKEKQRKNKLKEKKEKFQAEYMQKKEEWTNLNRLDNELEERMGDIHLEIQRKKETSDKLYRQGDMDAYKETRKQIEELKAEREAIPTRRREVWKKRFKVVEYLNTH